MLHVVAHFPVSSISYSFSVYLGITAIFQPYSTKNHVQLTMPPPILSNHHFLDGVHAEGLNAKQALLTPGMLLPFWQYSSCFLFDLICQQPENNILSLVLEG